MDAAPPPLPKAGRTPRHLRWLLWFGILAFVALLLLVSLRVTNTLKLYKVPTNGMAPTVQSGDCLIAERPSLWSTPVAQGDVIVFSTSGISGIEMSRGPSGDYIQRVAAVAGDKIELTGTDLLVNGVPFVSRTSEGEVHHPDVAPKNADTRSFSSQATVPEGMIFTVGDNTYNSFDGRHWGFVPIANIKFRAWVRYLPPQRAGKIK